MIKYFTSYKQILLLAFFFFVLFGGYFLTAEAQVVAPKGLYFLEITSPRDSPFGSYKRYHDFHKINGTYFIQAWLFTPPGGTIPCYPGRTDCPVNKRLNPWPTIWLTLDGVRITGPINAPPYQTSLNTRLYEDGSHVVGADVIANDGSDIQVVAATVTIDNTIGGRTGPQRVAACPVKYDLEKGLRPGCDWSTYPGSYPGLSGFPLPDTRPGTLYTSLVSSKDLWVERMTTTGNFLYKFYETPGNHITILPRQRYAHADLNYPLIPLVDGPRNVNQEGYLVGGYVDKTNGDLYAIATQGNFVQITTRGDIITHAGQRLKLGVNPYFWNSGFVNLFGSSGPPFAGSRSEIIGNFVDGPKGLKEPWDVVQDPLDPTGKTAYISDTLNHRIVKVDMKTLPATVTTYAGSLIKTRGYKDGVGTEALFNEPWGLAIDASGNLYVTDRLNHALRKIDTSRKVTTIIKSAKNPGNAGITDNYRTVGTSGLSLAARQSMYMINGNLSSASLIFPEGLEFNSEGKLIVAENFMMTLRKIDLATNNISAMGTIPSANDANLKNININIDTEGTCGPKDDILIATFAQTGPWRLNANGGYRGNLFTISNKIELPTGRANTMVDVQYPWLAICGNGAIWTNGAATQGVFRTTLAKTTDPVMSASDIGRYSSGRQIYKSGGLSTFPPRPSFELTHGVDGINHNGNFPSFDELNSASDDELKTQIQAGWGSSTGPRPEISGRDLDNLIFYIRWNCVPCIRSGNIRATPLPGDITAPIISGITIEERALTSAKIKWTTSEPTVGFIKFWRTAPHGGFSNVEDSYKTNHEVTVTGLSPGITYFYTIRSKDEPGNQAVSSVLVFTTINDGSTDTVKPSVTITNPINDSTVTGTITISAVASDDKGVAGVQFQVDGVNFGSEDQTAPYSVSWDTATALAGIHRINAIARDAAGNTAGAIPVFVKINVISPSTLIKAVKSGLWSNMTTWDRGRIPNATDDVEISNSIVTYDMGPSSMAAEAKTITIAGSGVLSFSRTKSTQLDMDGSIMVLEGGKLDVGTTSSPIPAGINARIGFNVPNDRLFLGGNATGPDPMMPMLIPADIGVWTMGTGSRADFYGAPKPKVWTKLVGDSSAGSLVVTLKDTPLGWRVGDKVLVTSSSNNADQSEVKSISAINGNKITLNVPLLFEHKGTLRAYNTVTKNSRIVPLSGGLLADEIFVREQAEVALLTQNVQVVSNLVKENDPNHRAHLAYMMGSRGSLAYTEFRDLGPRGKMGRYPVHLHKLGDAAVGTLIKGISIWSSVLSPMNKCIVIHSSNGITVQDSVGFNAQGTCYYFEEADELGNTLENNLGVLVHFPEELFNTAVASAFSYDPRSSSVFWYREGNTFRNNVAVSGKKDVAGFWLTPNLGAKGSAPTIFDGNESHSNNFGYIYSGDDKLTASLTRGFLWRNTVGLDSQGSLVKTTTSNTLFYQNGTYFLPPMPGVLDSNIVIESFLSPTVKFNINDRVQTTATLNVRFSPSISGIIIGTQPTAALGTVIGGPTVADGYNWWQINYDNAPDGWSVGDYLQTYVAPSPTAPTLTLSASPTTITSGSSVILTWFSTNATSCTASGTWSGNKAISDTQGTQVVNPAVTSTYTLTCTGAGGSATKSVIVTVTVSTATDSVLPTVFITTPTSGATVSGSSVAVSANASDNVGVTKVGLWKNGNHFLTDVVSPFVFYWDTTSEVNGSYSLQARAYDAAGNIGLSPTIAVIVNNIATNPVLGFPLILQGPNVPESKIAVVSTGSVDPRIYQDVVLELSAYDANIADEGELYVNGNGPIPLFGNSAKGANVYNVVMIRVSTPASWWKAGDNTLRFTHTKTAGYRVDAIQLNFIGVPQTTSARPSDSLWARSIASVQSGIGEWLSIGRHALGSVVASYQNLISELVGWLVR